MANTDYRIDLLPALQTGLQLGQQRLARRDRQQAEAARLEQEALQLEAQKQAAQQRALIDAQTLKLNEDRLTLQAQKYLTDEELARANLERQQWNDLLRNTRPARDISQGITYEDPATGAKITRNVPQSQYDATYNALPKKTVAEPLGEYTLVPMRNENGEIVQVPRIKEKLTSEEIRKREEERKRLKSQQSTNSTPQNIIGTWNPKSGFIRTTK